MLPLYYTDKRGIHQVSTRLSKPDQNLLFSYLAPETPYRSALVCYELGTGKTYAAAYLAHTYVVKGFSVLYTSSSLTSISSFKKEYENNCRELRLSQSLTTGNVTCITFAGLSKCMELNTKYGLIIIDEAHNLREKSARHTNISELLETYAQMSKIMVISATPMIDSEHEFDTLLDLGGDDTMAVFSDRSVKSDVSCTYQGTKVDNKYTLFMSSMRGEQLSTYKEIKNDAVYTKNRQLAICSSPVYNPAVPLKDQSCKIYRLITSLVPDELTVVFCFYIEYGINFLRQVLDEQGYEEWRPNMSEHRHAKPKFVIINGKTDSKYAEQALAVFNHITNVKGNRISMIIGSSVLSESVSLMRVKHVHILSPHWNYGQIDQSIGRVIRYNSHIQLPENERKIKVYLHACVNSKDIDIWKTAYSKRVLIRKRLDEQKSRNLAYITNYIPYIDIPPVQPMVVHLNDGSVWDLRDCFEKNSFQISWCRIHPDRAVGYSPDRLLKMQSQPPPDNVHMLAPYQTGYTVWTSIVDGRTRISSVGIYGRIRGKLISNVSESVLRQIARELNCNPHISEITNTLANQGRVINNQIVITKQERS